MTPIKLYTCQEAAELLHIKYGTLRIWHWRGTGPVVTKVGSRNMYREEDLQTYLNSNRRSSTSQTAEQAQLAQEAASV